LYASFGNTFAVRAVVSPVLMFAVFGNVTEPTAFTTFTRQVAYFPLPSLALQVIVVVPTLRVLIFPVEEILATSGFDDVHTRVLFFAFAGDTVAVKVPVLPGIHVSFVTFSLTDFTPMFTVTAQVTLRLLPSVVAQVIVVLPAETAVNLPFCDIVATLGFDEVHFRIFDAFAGVTVALKVPVLPVGQFIVLQFNLRLVARVVFFVTVTLQVAYLPLPSFALQVIVVVPTPTDVSLPVCDIVATLGFDDVHVSVLFMAFDGATVALKLALLPTGHLIVAALSFTLVTGLPTVTLQVTFKLLPSVVAQVIIVVPIAFEVSLPADVTVATLGFDDVHLSVLDAFDGVTVALKLALLPGIHLIVAAFNLSDVAFVAADTVTQAENAITNTIKNAKIFFTDFI